MAISKGETNARHGAALDPILADGLRVSCLDAGPRAPGEGTPPLLLLHGAIQTKAVWDDHLAAFAIHRRVVAPDLRGHGRTLCGTGELRMDRFVDDAFALLDALRIERAAVCGVSLGGMIALEMAARRPERVSALLLANTPSALIESRILRHLARLVAPERALFALFHLLGQGRTGRTGLFLARRLAGRGWVGEAAARHFTAGFSAMEARAIVETYRAILSADPARVRRLDMPVLILAGRHETALLLSHAKKMARRIETARLLTIGGGHVANLDAPEEFRRAVLAFLDALDAR